MLRILLFSLLFTVGLPSGLSAAVMAAPPVTTEITVPTRAGLEDRLGRKLTFRERLAVKVLARQQKRRHAKHVRRAMATETVGLLLASYSEY